MRKARWAIVSTGNIADKFTQSLKLVDGAVIEAVASRSQDKAKAFAEKHSIKKYYGSYEQMCMDPDIDIVYIATPNNLHYENSVMFMEQGKNVLCEKPLGVNGAQVKAMIKKADEKGVFFMEGMWTRFFPAVKKAVEWTDNGSIGIPQSLFASFGIDTSQNKDAWRYDRQMAGGAMMDVGIYPLAMAFAVFGTDYSEMYSSAKLENGVDVLNTVTLVYPDGRFAVLASAFNSIMENNVVITGTKGAVRINENWWHPKKAQLIKKGDGVMSHSGETEVFEQPHVTLGFQYEATAVQEYVLSGEKQAKEMTWDDSIKIAAAIDKLRAAWGVKYDEDTGSVFD